MDNAAHKARFFEELATTGREGFSATVELADLGVDAELAAVICRPGPICFLDFEATGLDPEDDTLIEAGAVLLEPGVTTARVFSTFIATPLRLSPFIKRLTSITDEDLDHAPEADRVATALNDFIGQAPVVAHNSDFEQKWLVMSVNPRFADHEFLDTVELLALVYPDSRNMKLDTFCRAKLGRKERHRAIDDALDTLRLTVNIIEEARRGDPAAANAYNALRLFKPSSPWKDRLAGLPTPETISTAAGQPDGDGQDQLPQVSLDLSSITARLEDEATVARIIPGYEARSGQIGLVGTIYNCFAGKGGKSIRLAEAGTGIGKTLAYLAVAIPFARKTGEQVIISTATKLLQSQLIEKDIPSAARLLGYSDLRFTSMKGRANYLCRHRLDAFLDSQRSLIPPPDSFPMALLSSFAQSTGHGEVDRIPQVLYHIHPDLERVRREVTSAEASECSRQDCERCVETCPFRSARNRLEGAEVVVVNHDLLLRWPPDYPPLRHLIIDEVHELAERADGAYARSAESVEILHRLEAVTSPRSKTKDAADAQVADLARRAVALVATVGSEARVIVGAAEPQRSYRDELAISPDGPGSAWKELTDTTLELASTLDSLARRLVELADDESSMEASAADTLLEAASVLSTSLPVPPSDVVARIRGLARTRSNAWRFVTTPVSPAADFQDDILDRVETLFGTSATIGVGEDMRGSVGSLEFEERSGGRFMLADPTPSPFDYGDNLEVIFLSNPTEHNRLVEKMAAAISTVALRLGGRTMGLFTSRDRLASVANVLDGTLSREGIDIIAPASGSNDPHELVRNFMESERAVLLGSRAFWQGVDVPGTSCQAVIIEKPPFDVPSDPLIRRRGELIEQNGGKAFIDYTLPRMLLRLKQMVGRLVRTSSDQGIVVVVEPRSDKRYFSKLQEALPPDARHRLVPLAELGEAVDEFLSRRS